MADITSVPGVKKETVYSGPPLQTNQGTVYNGPSPAGGGTVYGGPALKTGGTAYGGPAMGGTVYNARQTAAQPVAKSNATATKGAAIFFVIAAFSTINTLLIVMGSPIVLGIGLTTSKIGEAQMAGIILINVLVIGVFVLLGIFARHGSKAAFLIGMLLYGADTVLLLLGNPALHIPGIVVHGIFLVGLFKAFSQLES
jgi:hypothetical protein